MNTKSNVALSYVLHYFYGLTARSFNSAIAALYAFVGAAVGSTITPSIHAIGLKGSLAVFITTFALTALLYFKDHPIPDDLSEIVVETISKASGSQTTKTISTAVGSTVAAPAVPTPLTPAQPQPTQ